MLIIYFIGRQVNLHPLPSAYTFKMETFYAFFKEILEYKTNVERLFLSKRELVATSQADLQFRRTTEKFNIPDPAAKGKVPLHPLRHTLAAQCIAAAMPSAQAR